MFRLPVLVALTLAIAFGGGVWSASWTLQATSGFGAIRLGPWSAYPELQTASADPFAKAHRAGDGRLLLGRAEGLVFTASSDETGTPLSGRCSYEVSGSTPPARFWTLRVIDENGAALEAPPRVPTSLNSWTTLRKADGSFSIRLDSVATAGNWMWLDAEGEISLVLTLIDSPAAASLNMVELDMPKISRIGCTDA
ncbi:hypothetical protein SAMN05877838_2384 [Hoeflea halophila]|uniref:DUF1214 domain-containing protein n=1 Tax=Hoeflea halophila TaxID=714899 RepID=A0A286IDW5_9HYPH|nr:DUF1214 domain-containing protein [Hoeflea halophila]SOE17484.1 hypothetical protein SAMN05877838_2384 [Hoeflea halophila]